MIDPEAIADFLNEQRDSHAWIKKLSHAQLDDALADLEFQTYRPDLPLDKHQKACILLGIAYPKFAFWLDMGTGKTRIVLELLNYFWKRGMIEFALIMGISEEAIYGWEKQIALWNIDVPYVVLGNSSSKEKRAKASDLNKGFILSTYAGLTRMVAKRGKDSKGNNRLKRHEGLCKVLSEALDAAIFDESTRVGNQESLQYTICRYLSKNCKVRYALAGRPFNKDPSMVWSQQFLIDRGESLGPTLELFRGAFFHKKKGWFTKFEYTFDKHMQDDLARMMGHRSITYSEKECFTKPGMTRIITEVKLPVDVQAYYDKAVEGLRHAKGNFRETENIFLRMRQLSSGFIGFKDDETGEKAQLTFPHNPKLEALLDLIQAMPKDRKFLIFYEYTFSGRLIHETLKKRLKINTGWLWGGNRNGRAAIDAFDNSEKSRGLVINSKLGAMSLNLQTANYVYVYESPLSGIDRDQMEHRAFRKGQTRRGFLYDLIVKGTEDANILEGHRTGATLLEHLRRLQG